MVLGIINMEDAENSIQRLIDSGFDISEVSVLLKDRKQKNEEGYVAMITGTSSGIPGVPIDNSEILDIGGPISSMLGASQSEPNIQVVNGPLTAGLMNALMDIGLTEEDATLYSKSVDEGKVVVGVQVNSNEGKAVDSLKECGFENIISVSSESTR